MKYIIVLILVLISLTACNREQKNQSGPNSAAMEENPAAEGFDTSGSDAKAIAWADSVMIAMGGRERWDSLKFLQWNFFGIRDLLWNKQTGDVKIDDLRDSTVYYVNIHEVAGRVFRDSVELIEPDSLKSMVEKAKNIWINDSYWLVMPFKLKDSGVTLTYYDEDTTLSGIPAHILELTFDNIGHTPNNKYRVYIDKADHLVKQWAYFENASQDSATAIWPWDNYKEYNGIKLSADRSDGKGPKNVKVYQSLEEDVFSLLN